MKNFRGGNSTAVTLENPELVPVWTLTTENVDLPQIGGDDVMTPARLEELRTALATLAKTPLVTLEAYAETSGGERRDGISLGAASPLAKTLATLVSEAATATQSASRVAASGEVLYRMVVPAKVAAQVGGLIHPMASKAVAGGVRGALVNGKNIVGQASFVPVAGAGGAGALTLAAPLMLMAVAAGYSAYTDHRRDKALERITGLLEKLHQDKLDEERSRLEGCKDAIEKATAILLDKGKLGAGLGLDASVYEINVAIERANRRLRGWREALAKIKGPVEVGIVEKSFPGVTSQNGGEFRAHLELAKLAIALKRRVLVLQAVEHAQLEGADHPFRAFIETLKDTERRVNELETGTIDVLRGLSTLEVKRYGGIRSIYFSQGEVDDLLNAAYRLRAIGDEVAAYDLQADVAIDIERKADGSIIVFPALSA